MVNIRGKKGVNIFEVISYITEGLHHCYQAERGISPYLAQVLKLVCDWSDFHKITDPFFAVSSTRSAYYVSSACSANQRYQTQMAPVKGKME